jgi:hypothetical protein
VQKSHKDKDVCAPVVNVPDQSAEQDFILKMNDGLVGLLRKGLVNELQEHPGSQKQEHKRNRHTSQTPREGPAKRFFLDVSRPEVKNQTVEEPAVSLPNLFCSCCARKNGIADTLKQG